MKKFKKIFAIVLALLTVVALVGNTKTFAARDSNPKTTKVHITKLQSDSTPTAITHDGTQIADLTKLKDQLGVAVTPLGGVEFTYYKVPDQATLDKMIAAKSDYDTADKVKALLGNDGTKLQKTAETTGLVDVELQDGLYWFIETDAPKEVSSSVAVPFGISLPMTQPDGKAEMNDVYVYPKNVKADEPIPTKTVGTASNTATESYDVGKEFKWYLHTNIPANIKDYVELNFEDKLDSKLDYVGNVKVTYGNDVVPEEFYTVTPATKENPTFKVQFKTIETEGANKGKLAYFAQDSITQDVINGKLKDKLTVEFTSKINNTAVMGTVIENSFDLKFKNNPSVTEKSVPPTEHPKVVTGGKKFKKTDEKAAPLAGAKFIIQNALDSGTQYLKQNDDGTAVWTTNKDEAKVFTSQETTGAFEVKGLAFTESQQAGNKVTNKYQLIEIEAPKGYAIHTEAIDFTVNETSYTDDAASVQEVKNTKLTIPQTGGVGTVIYGVVGLVVMAGAVFMMRRRNQK